jgi:DNA-directed RNA polymerase beta' subunit
LHSLLRDVVYDEREAGSAIELVFEVPMHAKKMLLVSAAEEIAKTVFVRATKGIEKCFVETKEKGAAKEYVVTTDGVNFKAAWLHADKIDVNKIESNDIAALLRTYGVEAARASIMGQISAVFNAYGIGVDARHLSLIADYMTFQVCRNSVRRLCLLICRACQYYVDTCVGLLCFFVQFGRVGFVHSTGWAWSPTLRHGSK